MYIHGISEGFFHLFTESRHSYEDIREQLPFHKLLTGKKIESKIGKIAKSEHIIILTIESIKQYELLKTKSMP